MKKYTIKRSVILVLVALVAAAALVFGVYVGDYYHADASAQAALASDNGVAISYDGDNVVFVPRKPTAGLIFYPGGKVEYTAYAPLLHALAEDGVLCVLVKMPCNLAVLDINAADGIAARFPEVEEWYIGGHSLGGAMAASYAGSHADALNGLVLLAAYSTVDLHDSGLRVFTAYGSEDGVLNREKYAENRENLPDDTTEWVIDGGCHAGFGAYGAQDGDGVPTITAEEQAEITAEKVATWILE